MLSAPRLRSACCVGATTEKGTDCRFSSRLRAVTVTVTSSVNCGGSLVSATACSICPSGSACCAATGNDRTSSRTPNAQKLLLIGTSAIWFRLP